MRTSRHNNFGAGSDLSEAASPLHVSGLLPMGKTAERLSTPILASSMLLENVFPSSVILACDWISFEGRMLSIVRA